MVQDARWAEKMVFILAFRFWGDSELRLDEATETGYKMAAAPQREQP